MKTKRHKASLFTLLSVSLLLACFAFLTTSITPAHAVTTVPTTMNFQGRLADSSGNIMPDGLYNMQFKLFTVGSGGSAVWNETRENNGTDYRVQVTNGLFSTKLGQASPLSASLFASGSLYFEITMATPATATCSTASCASWESPMTPRHELSTSAYAYNAETLDGYDSSYFATATGATGYIQNTTTPQTADFNITGTGTANILRATTFDRATAGTLTVGGTNATSISLADDTTLASGKTLRVVGDTYTNIDGYPSPTEGQITYDQTNDQLLVYNATLGKWMSDKSDAILVAASNSSQADKNAADYVADGEIGDGQTTLDGDQVEINQALAAGAGKKVILLAGTYTADATILIPNNTTLAGVGAGTLIQLADIDVSDNLIENSDTTTGTGVTIRDLKLDGQKALNTAGDQFGIYLNGMGSQATSRVGARIMNITVNNFSEIGVEVLLSDLNKLENIYASGNDYAGIFFDWGNYNTLSDSTIIGSGSGYSGTNYGVYSYATNNSIVGNNVSQTTDIAIVAGTKENIANNTVSDNEIGIKIEGSYSLVSNNIVEQNRIKGISIYRDYSVLSNNVIANSGGDTANNGIYLSSTANSSTITGNTITDTSATTSNHVINIEAGSDLNYLADNRFSSTPGTSTINDLGTGTVYSNQPLAENGGSITTRTTDGLSLQATSGDISLLTNSNSTGVLVQSVTNSATAFEIQNAASNVLFGVDTSASKVLFGTAGSVGGALQINAATSGNVTISIPATTTSYNLILPSAAGSAGQCLINSSTPGTLTWGSCGGGTTQTVSLIPEFAGGTLSADGSDNNGVMISEYDAVNDHTYYEWDSSQNTLQDYSIVVRTKVPSDYVSGFGSFSVWLYGGSTSTSDNDVQVEIRDSGTVCSSLSSYLPGTAFTWTQQAITTSGCTTIAADDIITINIKVFSKSNNAVRVGGVQYIYTN